jgi:hypothetical protein
MNLLPSVEIGRPFVAAGIRRPAGIVRPPGPRLDIRAPDVLIGAPAVPRVRGRDRLAVRSGSRRREWGKRHGRQGNLHRETLRAALRVIQTAGTLEEARTQLARMLNVFNKLEAKGIKGDAAVAEAENRLTITRVPKATAADERPVRRRESG